MINRSLRDRLVVYEMNGTAADTLELPTLGYSPPRLNVTFPGGSASYSIPFMSAEH